MSETSPAPRPVRWFRVGLAALALHVLTAFPFPTSGPALSEWVRPSLDAVALLWCGALGIALGIAGALTRHLVALGFCFAIVWRACAWAMRTYYQRELDPYQDVMMLPGLRNLILYRVPEGWHFLFEPVAVVLTALAYWLLVRTVGSLLDALARPRARIAVVLFAQVVLLARWTERATLEEPHPSSFFQRSAFAEASSWAGRLCATRGWRTDEKFRERVRLATSAQPPQRSDLALLRGTDVHVLFVESYGRGLLRSEAGPEFERRLRAHEARLAAHGFHCCTGILFPSMRGAMSHLAHGEFLSGIEVENERIYDRLLRSDLVPMPRRFAEAGFATVCVHPAMPIPWPMGKFFGFQKNLFRGVFGYRGRQYHWGYMPDQFALATVLDRVVKPSKDPLFLMFVSVTSHAPFAARPPYFENWEDALAEGAFTGAPAIDFGLDIVNFATHPRVLDAYLETVDYGLVCAFGYAQRLERKSLVMVLGDHQPPIPGEFARRDISKDVPMHVVAKDLGLLAPFLAAGFVPGLVPKPEQVGSASARFLEHFVGWFSSR